MSKAHDFSEQGSRSGFSHLVQKGFGFVSFSSSVGVQPSTLWTFCWFGDLARIIGSENFSDGFYPGESHPDTSLKFFANTHRYSPTSFTNLNSLYYVQSSYTSKFRISYAVHLQFRTRYPKAGRSCIRQLHVPFKAIADLLKPIMLRLWVRPHGHLRHYGAPPPAYLACPLAILAAVRHLCSFKLVRWPPKGAPLWRSLVAPPRVHFYISVFCRLN